MRLAGQRGSTSHAASAALLLALLPLPTAAGSDDLVAWLYPHLVPGTFEASYEYGFRENRDQDQPTELDRLQLDGQVRLSSQGDQCAFLSAGYEDLAYPTEIVLPDGQPVPRHLRSALVGATWEASRNHTTLGLHVDAGSASDRLFANADTLVVDATLFAKWPISPVTSWVAFLNYDSNRPYLERYPIPALAIEYHPSADLDLLIGVPVLYLSWHPYRFLLIEASFVVNADLDIYAYVTPKWSISASYAWYGQSFRLGREPHQGAQIGFEDMRASLGISYDATPETTLRLLGGYLFERYVYSGTNTTILGDYKNSRSLPATPVVALTFSIN